MKKGVYISTGVILIAAVTVIVLLRESPAEQIAWDTKTIDRGDVIIEVTASGTVEAVTKIEIGTQVSGKIDEIFVDFNSKVKKGQVIARLDTTTLAAQAFDARANVERMKIQLRKAERDFKRTKDLFAQNVVARIDYDNALDTYETAKSNLLSSQAQLNRALINLNYATITSPIDGVVVSRSVEVGQTVAASFNSPTLFTIVNDLTKMEVQANVDEADIGQVKVGQEVSFTVDAYPDDEFKGTVKQIRMEPVIVSNVVNYIVIIDVPNPDLKLLPGMTANLSIIVDKRENVLRVPSRALSFRPPEDYLKKMVENLPDSVKQQQDERIQRIRERMKSMGMSDREIDRRIAQFQQRMRSGGGQGSFRGGGGAGMQGGNMMQMPDKSGIRKSGTGRSFGRLWIMDPEQGKPRLVRVRTGLTDGRFVEVEGGNLKVGDQVVISASVNDDKKTDSANATRRSPFMPRFGRGHR
ncbi:MAG: efflux RND transporter periplasmic adaptor subunit [Chlorobi bacterium]|nr:efflux RND transporter periplasmic adaptor subunit [Chlorobiota bacterium]